ncbi:efflux RND transporter periplasmic adaptor subunit [Pantoea agglomerans]|uniref:efflux RND transporter periplasmic adaptor subunit n=1 Tax=Enterobacter agglomerans TaxID=549 RepID=UPI001E47CA32|nr:efflux RND transporter periplasmic adaptor subunit [Pantoea agglomerans]
MTTRTFLIPKAYYLMLSTLLLAGCDRSSAMPPAPSNEVGVITLKNEDVTLTTELSGRTSAFLVAEIRPQVSGILKQRLFEEGSVVKAGQPLYQIDPASYRATLSKQEAALQSAKLLAQRYERLIKYGAISRQDADDARSTWLQAQASVDAAKIDLGYTTITAPISGRIGRSSVTQGALLTANQTDAIATIQQLDPIYVDIPQSSTALLKLQEELSAGLLSSGEAQQTDVRLRLDTGKDYAYPGRLKFSEVTVDEATDSVIIRAQFPNPDGRLLPGMFVRARIQDGVRKGVILVPQRGLTRDSEGGATVLVVEKNNKAALRKVITERLVGNQWVVSEGLKAGDRVIVDGRQNVQPGQEVKAIPAVITRSDQAATQPK